jgi:hypothetical protein
MVTNEAVNLERGKKRKHTLAIDMIDGSNFIGTRMRAKPFLIFWTCEIFRRDPEEV